MAPWLSETSGFHIIDV